MSGSGTDEAARKGKPRDGVLKNPEYKAEQVDRMIATRLAASSYARYFKTPINRLLMVNSVALGLSLMLNFYQASRPVPVTYIYADRTGRVMVLYAMNTPNMSDNEAASWVARALTRSLSLDYINYKNQLQDAHGNYFTPHGWDTFQKMLTANRLLQLITDNDYIIEAQVSAAPVLESSGVMNGEFAWNWRIPITLSMHGVTTTGNQTLTKASESHSMIAHVIMTRLPEIASERGVGIARIVLTSE